MQYIFGNNEDNTLSGGSGNDEILGGKGDDTMTGGAGADTFYFRSNEGDDTITDFSTSEDVIGLQFLPGVLGFDSLTITQDGDDALIDLSDNGGGSIRLKNVNVDDLSADNFQFFITSGDGDDTITGAKHDDYLLGEAGDDTISGGAGDDYLFGGDGDDTISGGAGEDYISGGSGDDTLSGGTDADTFAISSDNGTDKITDFSTSEDIILLDALHGIMSFDSLTITQDGDDALIDLSDFGGGSIRLEGVNKDDLSANNFQFSISGTENNDTMQGADNDDYIWGFAGDDTLSGGGGNDEIKGHSGNDTIFGGAGSDLIYGGEGDDTLDGGEGDDELDGGTGADTFVFAPGHGNDYILGFTNGEDKIDLTAITDITGFDDLSISKSGNNAVIDLSDHGGGKITLQSVDTSVLDAADFTFYEAPAAEGEVEGI